jgi:hypothetical protein
VRGSKTGGNWSSLMAVLGAVFMKLGRSAVRVESGRGSWARGMGVGRRLRGVRSAELSNLKVRKCGHADLTPKTGMFGDSVQKNEKEA